MLVSFGGMYAYFREYHAQTFLNSLRNSHPLQAVRVVQAVQAVEFLSFCWGFPKIWKTKNKPPGTSINCLHTSNLKRSFVCPWRTWRHQPKMYQCSESCSKHRGLLQHLMLLSQFLLAICKLLRHRNGLEPVDQLMHFNTGTFGWKIRQEGDLILLAGAVLKTLVYMFTLCKYMCVVHSSTINLPMFQFSLPFHPSFFTIRSCHLGRVSNVLSEICFRLRKQRQGVFEAGLQRIFFRQISPWIKGFPTRLPALISPTSDFQQHHGHQMNIMFVKMPDVFSWVSYPRYLGNSKRPKQWRFT